MENTIVNQEKDKEQKVYICADCGRVISEDELDDCLQGENADGEEIIICPDCEDNWARCYDCECIEPKDDMYYCEDNDEYYCEHCQYNNLTYCERCETYHLNQYMHKVYVDSYNRNKYEWWCDDCVDNCAIECSECGDLWSENCMESIRTSMWGDYTYICPRCLEDYHWCGNCERYVDDDNWNYDYDCCCDCAEEYGHDSRIACYHDAPSIQFYGKMKTSWRNRWRGMGIELEVDKLDKCDESDLLDEIEEVFGDEVYYEQDGSLCEGFEIITQPHTIEEFYKMNWNKVLESIKSYGYRSHDMGTCGLHVHISRDMFGSTKEKQSVALSKLVYFYDKYYNDIKKVSRRRDEQWCHKYNVETRKQAEKVVENNRHNDRYHAVNLTNYETIEFRIMRGTLNQKSFWASIDFVLTLAKNARKINWKNVDDVSQWLAGMKEETYDYIKSRHAFEDYLTGQSTNSEESYIEEVA